MAKLIGNAPNQISTNGDLGSMAFEDKKNYATTSSPIYQPYRNIIINGDMSIAQRGISATGLGNGDTGYYTVDRWQFGEDVGSPTYEFTMSQETDVPTGQGFAKSLKMDCTTAQGSLVGFDSCQIRTIIEGQNLQYLKKGTANALSTTLSFWVKTNKTGTYIAELFDDDNTRQISKSYTVNVANTWEKKTVTFEGDTTGAFNNDNGRSLYLVFWLVAGSSFSSGTLSTTWTSNTNANRAVGQVNLADSTSNDFYITGVQLEAGTSASDFEFLPYDVNLQRCQRYFISYGGETQYERFGVGTVFSSSVALIQIHYPVSMRARASLSFENISNHKIIAGSVQSYFTGYTEDSSSTKIAHFECTGASGLTIGQASMLFAINTNVRLQLSAEL
jgi:hypothetical protein